MEYNEPFDPAAGKPLEVSEEEMADFVTCMKEVAWRARLNAGKAVLSARKIILR